MKSVYNFVVTPVGERYNNKKKIGKVTEVVSATSIKVDHVEEALADDDEICVRNPIIFNFGLEY